MQIHFIPMKRVRFAPSPTGNLHIGTLRTALFNWLFAKAQGGTFVLRIEDTDQARSSDAFEQNIFDGMDWMGMTEDEGPQKGGDYGPYRQSERLAEGIYQKELDKLLGKGLAYYCFCTDEDLEAEREAAKEKNIPYVYSRKSLQLTKEDVQEKLANNEPYTIRFKIPDSKTLTVRDGIRNPIDFDCSLISDFVLQKSDGFPSYNFSVVVDDALMEITDVIRGEDHISNTPKQVLLFQALGYKVPTFYHLPMILGQDKSKLSKRHGATAVTDYQKQGFLSDALFNFLSLLGWSPSDTTEIMSREVIEKQFSMERVSRANAVFDTKKLTWMNGQYIRSLSKQSLYDLANPYLTEASIARLQPYSDNQIADIVYAVKDNLNVLADVNDYLDSFNTSENDYKQALDALTFDDKQVNVISHFAEGWSQLKEITKDAVAKLLDAEVERADGKKGMVLKPLRLALTGQQRGPNLVDVLSILPGDTLKNRIDYLKDSQII